MSYDLYFWRQPARFAIEPEKVMNMIAADQNVEGLTAFSVSEIKRAFAAEFPDIEDNGPQLVWEADEGGFDISWAMHPGADQTSAIIAACGHGLLEAPEILNRIIEVAAGFGCALYDPQVNQRFEQPR